MPVVTIDLQALEHELKSIGTIVSSSRQNTVISIEIKGLVGKKLIKALELADQLVLEKVSAAWKSFRSHDTKLFSDPTFGPSPGDPVGISALCKPGIQATSKPKSQHQARVLPLVAKDGIRWERPKYASDDLSMDIDTGEYIQEDDYENDYFAYKEGRVPFATQAKLFSDGASSGDVIQGNLGDCWLLSALSVVATRFDLLSQIFWRKDMYRDKGLFVCRFMKNFVWHYVIIDDLLPVFGYTSSRPGKPFFARSPDPNELWVSLIEKAYAKLHGGYEFIIGGYVDVALNDLTGMCSEQVILKDGFPGFHEDPFYPVCSNDSPGDTFWRKLLRYKSTGTLMGCSIQPPPNAGKNVGVESNAGFGLYYKHAYALVDADVITTKDGKLVKLLKLRNPWGMGEWNGPWSDASKERMENQDVIEKHFKVLRRNVGANATKRMNVTISKQGDVRLDEVKYEEETEVNFTDGTFYMQYSDWMQHFTHFFAGIDFPDEWQGRRSEGMWTEESCGGNFKCLTWSQNPKFELSVREQSHLFLSLYQEDRRGRSDNQVVPVAFHICSLTKSEEVDNVYETKEPAGKEDAYYRFYSAKEKEDYAAGRQSEPIPPAVIPGSVIHGVNERGVAQPTYTLKQEITAELTMDPGRYCVVPSMFKRTGRDSDVVNVGRFWLSVYSDKPSFRLQGGEEIAEEEEGEEESKLTNERRKSRRRSSITIVQAKDMQITSDTASVPSPGKKSKFGRAQDELQRKARAKHINMQLIGTELTKGVKVSTKEVQRRLMAIGFSRTDFTEDTLKTLAEAIGNSGRRFSLSDDILSILGDDEDLIYTAGEMMDENTPEDLYRRGMLEIKVVGAKNLRQNLSNSIKNNDRPVRLCPLSYTQAEIQRRTRLAAEILEAEPDLMRSLRPILRCNYWKRSLRKRKADESHYRYGSYHDKQPFEIFMHKLYVRWQQEVEEQNEQKTSDDSPRQFLLDFNDIGLQNDDDRSMESGRSGGLRQMNGNVNVEPRFYDRGRGRNLENRRVELFVSMYPDKKQSVISEQSTVRPRFFNRSSRTAINCCCDCGTKIESDRINRARCQGNDCTKVFCTGCYSSLPASSKFCESCFEDSSTTDEYSLEQLRATLVQDIGGASEVEAWIASWKADGKNVVDRSALQLRLADQKAGEYLSLHHFQRICCALSINGGSSVDIDKLQEWLLEGCGHSQSPGAHASNTDANAVDMGSIVDYIFDVAWNGVVASICKSHWTSATTSTQGDEVDVQMESVQSRKKRSRLGKVLMERLVSIPTYEPMDVLPINQLLLAYSHKEKQMTRAKLHKLFADLDIPLTDDDVKLLHLRFRCTEGNAREVVDVSGLMTYMLQMCTSSPTTSNTIQDLLQIHECCRRDDESRSIVADLLGQVDPSLSKNELCILATKLSQAMSITCQPSSLIKIARIFDVSAMNLPVQLVTTTSTEENPKLPMVKSCGTALASIVLDQDSVLVSELRGFHLDQVCSIISTFIYKQYGYESETELWTRVTGRQWGETITQKELISKLIDKGLELTFTDQVSGYERISKQDVSRVHLALAIDLLREKLRMTKLPVLTFALFAMLIQYNRIYHVDAIISSSLRRYEQRRLGLEHLLVQVKSNEEDEVVRFVVNDPVLRQELVFVIPAKNCVWNEAPDFKHGVSITRLMKNNRLLHALPDLLSRLRLCYASSSLSQHQKPSTFSYLKLVESRQYVETLRNVLNGANPPVFWSLTQSALTFKATEEQLELRKVSSVERLVVESFRGLGRHSKALMTFIQHTSSILSVRLVVVGHPGDTVLTWNAFQQVVMDMQDIFVRVHFYPQDVHFVTPTTSGSSTGSLMWNYAHSIPLTLPAEYNHRLDRPIVFTDTVELQGDEETHTNDLKKMAFTSSELGTSGRFVIVNVRRAPCSDQEPARLYCTAYDPFTACDYTVEGCPSDLPLNFFHRTGYEAEWHGYLNQMSLGMILSPRLVVQLYCKHAKMNNLMGQCEVDITPAVTHEGQLFNDWICLNGATVDNTEVGSIQLAYSFQSSRDIQDSSSIVTESSKSAFSGKRTASISLSNLQGFGNESDSDKKEDDIERERMKNVVAMNNAKSAADELALQQAQSALKQATHAAAHANQEAARLKDQIHTLERMAESRLAKEKRQWEAQLKEREKLYQDERKEADERLRRIQQELEQREEEQASASIANEISITPSAATNWQQTNLQDNATAEDIFAEMKNLLRNRCPTRPYNGLKKALANVAEIPGKVSTPALEDVMEDFGLSLSTHERLKILDALDFHAEGRVSIEAFIAKIIGEKEVSPIPSNDFALPESPSKQDASSNTVEFPPAEIRPGKKTPRRPERLNWHEMKKILMLNLPTGWEVRYTDKGRPYFCNHSTRSTHWKHPVPEIDAKFREWTKNAGVLSSTNIYKRK